jgi:hypothetical protein
MPLSVRARVVPGAPGASGALVAPRVPRQISNSSYPDISSSNSLQDGSPSGKICTPGSSAGIEDQGVLVWGLGQ